MMSDGRGCMTTEAQFESATETVSWAEGGAVTGVATGVTAAVAAGGAEGLGLIAEVTVGGRAWVGLRRKTESWFNHDDLRIRELLIKQTCILMKEVLAAEMLLWRDLVVLQKSPDSFGRGIGAQDIPCLLLPLRLRRPWRLYLQLQLLPEDPIRR